MILAGCSAVERTPAIAPTVTPAIIRTIPHDSLAFTQGLVYLAGKLYESTGAPAGTGSSLRMLDASTGAMERNLPINAVFAEGLAIAGNNVVQITWRDKTGFVYSLADFSLKQTIRYEGEGWGLTWNGSQFIMSNGSDTLLFRDSAFAISRKVAVTHKSQPLKNLNELEYCKGAVYANVWFSNYIFKIDPADGKVVQLIDCSELVRRSGTTDENAVLNGIAFNDSTGSFYLTGKNWKVIFEVKLP